jgi:hypothetical protein
MLIVSSSRLAFLPRAMPLSSGLLGPPAIGSDSTTVSADVSGSRPLPPAYRPHSNRKLGGGIGQAGEVSHAWQPVSFGVGSRGIAMTRLSSNRARIPGATASIPADRQTGGGFCGEPRF